MLKVLHLPNPVGGQAWGLAQAERQLGLDSKVLVTSASYLQYPADYFVGINKHGIWKGFNLLKTFFQIRNAYDVFHFNYGSSLFHGLKGICHLEVPFYPRDARLFVTYNGCDARQKYPTMERTDIAACHMQGCYNGMCNSGELDIRRRQGIEKLSRYVKHMWALNPDLLHFLPPDKSSFLPYAVKQTQLGSFPPKMDKRLKILHAPTQREAKGTLFILQALDKLKAKYAHLFDIVLVENLSHNEALRQYQQADLVIDQILIGWYGGFAVEVMGMGKPVIARIAEADLKFIPKNMAKDLLDTVINANPRTLYDVLEYWIHNRVGLLQRGQASLEYVNRWHDPLRIAEITKEKYGS